MGWKASPPPSPFLRLAQDKKGEGAKRTSKQCKKSFNPKIPRNNYPLNPKIPREKDKKSTEKHKYKKPWKVDKPLTSAVFIAEARDSTMWTVLWTVWTETARTKASPPALSLERELKKIEGDWNLPLSPPSFDKTQDRKEKGTEAPS